MKVPANQYSAERWAHHEPKARRCAQPGHASTTVITGGHVCNVSGRGRQDRRRKHAANNACSIQQRECGRRPKENLPNHVTCDTHQQQRSSACPVRPASPHWGEHELPQRIRCGQKSDVHDDDFGRSAFCLGQTLDEKGQDGKSDTNADHDDEHADEKDEQPYSYRGAVRSAFGKVHFRAAVG